MKRFIITILAICSLSSVCSAAATEGEQTLAERFKASVDPKLTFIQKVDGLQLYEAFYDDPAAFLAELSKQPQKIQVKVASLLAWRCGYYGGQIGEQALEDALAGAANRDEKGPRQVIALIRAEMERKTPDYRELFTRETDGWVTSSYKVELRLVFERDPYEFVSRLSVYKVKWQLNVCFLLSVEYFIAEETSALKGILSSLRKDDRPKTYLFHITLDNITNEAQWIADRWGQDW